MRDTALTILFAFLLFIALPVLLLWIRDKAHELRKRRTPEQLEASNAAYRARLLNPKPEEVEHSLRGLLPRRLVELYSDHETILCEGLELRPPARPANEFGEWVEYFLPLDTKGQELTVNLSEAGRGMGFSFATDGCGNFYWVPLSETRQMDAPVYFACHDPWGIEKVTDSLEEFLNWPRVSRPKKR